jgi:hypothetical protein
MSMLPRYYTVIFPYVHNSLVNIYGSAVAMHLLAAAAAVILRCQGLPLRVPLARNSEPASA